MRKVRLTPQDVQRISQTPNRECWLCAYFTELIDEDEEGYYLLEHDLKDDGMWEHLRQLVGPLKIADDPEY